MNVQERITRIDKLQKKLENHCMCAEFIIRDNAYVRWIANRVTLRWLHG